ncbi:hypothetical protein SAMN02745166_01077 [Prosthecobacter debontii]|uniref:Uncharacterized protein n=1 Tax=Prosthecobacter debontii TaxID=48467 RepID=A0A1T4X5T8_9BACT|nr:hypothetical protein [Prosthecobacter debontii]SKA84952.1 hypothetical protein SAMN02745166_01077 [Prosthecobacter debontii]
MSDLTTSAEVDAFMSSSSKAEMRTALDLGNAATKSTGTGADEVATGNHSHTGLSVQAAGTPSVRALGTGSAEACAGDDSRLSDARTPTSHTHDDRYYTESEIDTALSGKADASHNHDDRYYTESEIDTALAGKANASHTHSISNVTGLQTALDAKLAASDVLDEDNMASNSATNPPSQQSVKAYVDANVGGGSAVAGTARFRVYKSTNQTINNNVETTVTWDVEEFDSANIFSSNAVTIPNGQGWLIAAKVVHLNSNVATSYNLRIKDGSTVIRETPLGGRYLQATDDHTVALTSLVEGNGNAWTVTLQQVSGETRSLESGTEFCEFWGVRLW